MSRRFQALAPVALAALTLTACWPVPGGNADRTAHNPFETAFTPATVGDLEPAWVADLGPGATGPVIVDRGGVFVRVGQDVSRLDLRTGSLRWIWTLPEEVPEEWATVSDPLVVGGRVLVGYGFGNLGGHWEGAALDPATGEPTSDPAATGLLQTARGPLVLDENFGFVSGGGTITVSYGVTDVGAGTSAGGGTLAAIEFGEASESGRFTLGSSTVYHVGTGILADGDTYTQGVGVRAFALDAPSTCGPPVAPFFKCPTWTIPLTGVTLEAVLGPGEEVVYVGRTDGTVVALDAGTGGVLWTTPVGAAVTSTPALADGVLYVPTADGDLVAVDAGGCGAATCAPLWSAPVDGTGLGQPAVAGTGDDAVVFVGTGGGTLAAMAAVGCGAPACGAPLWQTSLGAAAYSLAISGGQVIVGTSTGRVAAFRIPTG